LLPGADRVGKGLARGHPPALYIRGRGRECKRTRRPTHVVAGRGTIDAGQPGVLELSWLGGFGHSVCASTDFPFCCTVGAADWPSPPASGRMALRSIGCCFGGSSPLLALDPVVVLPVCGAAAAGRGAASDGAAAPGRHGS